PAPELGGDFCEPAEVSRGLASGDLDDDGDVDFVVTNCGGPARVYTNVAPKAGHWLLVRPIDTRMNRDAIGATVAVFAGGEPIVRKIDPSSSYLTANDSRAHFGLGRHGRYDRMEVTWTDGVVEEFPAGPADRVVTLWRRSGGPSGGNEQ
ncbi:MAG: ASPIC/UnbV domain-containing protein, partial [Planctomycetaceae bacterium]